jgi:hypothetical protein
MERREQLPKGMYWLTKFGINAIPCLVIGTAWIWYLSVYFPKDVLQLQTTSIPLFFIGLQLVISPPLFLWLLFAFRRLHKREIGKKSPEDKKGLCSFFS